MSQTVTDELKRKRTAEPGKYLTFMLAREEYGVEILKVQEIIGLIDITKVPRVPEYIQGVINLRGKVIPVIDLRLKFGLVAGDYTERTCIIVVQVEHDRDTIIMGCIVDEVCEVINFAAEQIEPSPDFGIQVDTGFILGIGKAQNERVAILMDVDKVLSSEEVAAVSAVG